MSHAVGPASGRAAVVRPSDPAHQEDAGPRCHRTQRIGQIVRLQVQAAPTMLGALGTAGTDFSVSEADLTDWLNNPEFTPYPALSEALLMLLDGRRLRRPVFLDVIVFNYEHSPGNPSPRKVDGMKFAVLEAAVVEGSNIRYGEAVSNFRDLLVNAV